MSPALDSAVAFMHHHLAMLLFEITVALLLIGAILALWADRIGMPYPALLALAGTAIALIPRAPHVALDPELALALFVAPVLLDAAYDASPRDLKRNLLAVSSLAVMAVLLTVAAVAFVVRWRVPGVGWAVAIALGAIVAPPDASAAAAVLRKLRPPHRLLVVLEGESLFNDATALFVYRLAVGAAVGASLYGWRVLPMLLLSSIGSVAAGILLARAYLKLTARVEDIPISILLQFIGTFAVWLLAARLGLSPILTMIGYAMTLARRAPGRVGARRRIASYAVWEVAVFVLNVLAFVLIGLQLRVIAMRVTPQEWPLFLSTAAAVCVTVILVRLAWVMLHGLSVRWLTRRAKRSRPPPGSGILVSWSGMRGIVTLATALALPGAAVFPHRDLVVFCAFAVVLFTLIVQGSTLRPLMRWLDLRDDGSVVREMMLARVETARAAIGLLRERAERPVAAALSREYEARLLAGERGLPVEAASDCAGELAQLQRLAVEAQRRSLIDLRARGVIGDDAFHLHEEEIDLLELSADVRVRPWEGEPARD